MKRSRPEPQLRGELNRRDLLRGFAVFLGAQALGLGLGSGCQSTPSDQELLSWTQIGRDLHRSWTPPPEMITLGQEILDEHNHIKAKIRSLLAQLNPERSTLKGDQRGASPEMTPEVIGGFARRVRDLHLEAAESGHWVDVDGWRLSEVEAAAYAIIALNA